MNIQSLGNYLYENSKFREYRQFSLSQKTFFERLADEFNSILTGLMLAKTICLYSI